MREKSNFSYSEFSGYNYFRIPIAKIADITDKITVSTYVLGASASADYLFLRRGLGARLCSSCSFETFLIFPYFLRS